MDPNNMTVEKLKKELTELNVPLPRNPKKEVLVELYRMHALPSRPGGKTNVGHRLEFSDEDEVVEDAKSRKSLGALTKRRSLTTRTKDETIISSSGINISNMSDAELMEALQKYGADVGPVTDTTRTVYEKKLIRLMNSSPQGARVSHISPLKKKELEEQPARRLIHYSDEEEDVEEEEENEEEEEEQEEEDEGYRNDDNRQQSRPLYDRHNNRDYEDSFATQSRYTTSYERYNPSARHSMEFAARPPLSSFGLSDSFSSQPFSSGLASTTRRSHVYTSSEYSSVPRSTALVRDSLLSGTGTSKSGLHTPWQTSVPKPKEKKRGRCFWLLIFIVLLVILLTVVFWNMDPAYHGFALPDFQAKE